MSTPAEHAPSSTDSSGSPVIHDDSSGRSKGGAANVKSPWFLAAVTVAGSSGLLAVFGLITGEMYWDGYLSAFGLNTDEFPVTSSNARIYAYVAILYAVKSVLTIVFSHWIAYSVLVAVTVLLSALFGEPSFASRLLPKIERLRQKTRDSPLLAYGLRCSLMLAAFVAFVGAAAYLGLIVWLVAAAPTQARVLGKEEGVRELAKLRLFENSQPERCGRIDAQSRLAGKCVFAIAFGDKAVAVLSENRIHRVARDGLALSSPASAHPATALSPASAPSAASTASSDSH